MSLGTGSANERNGAILSAAILRPDLFYDVRIPNGDVYPTGTYHSVHAFDIKCHEVTAAGTLAGSCAVFLHANWNAQHLTFDKNHNMNKWGTTPYGCIGRADFNSIATDWEPDKNMQFYLGSTGLPDPNNRCPYGQLRCVGARMSIQDLQTPADELGGEWLLFHSMLSEWDEIYLLNQMDPHSYVTRPLFLMDRNRGQKMSISCLPIDEEAYSLNCDTYPVKGGRAPGGAGVIPPLEYRLEQKYYGFNAGTTPDSYCNINIDRVQHFGWTCACFVCYNCKPGAEFHVTMYANYEGYPSHDQWPREEVARPIMSELDRDEARKHVARSPEKSIDVEPMGFPTVAHQPIKPEALMSPGDSASSSAYTLRSKDRVTKVVKYAGTIATGARILGSVLADVLAL